MKKLNVSKAEQNATGICMNLKDAISTKKAKKDERLRKLLSDVLPYDKSIIAINDAIDDFIKGDRLFDDYGFLYYNDKIVYAMDSKAIEEAKDMGYRIEQTETGMKIYFK